MNPRKFVLICWVWVLLFGGKNPVGIVFGQSSVTADAFVPDQGAPRFAEGDSWVESQNYTWFVVRPSVPAIGYLQLFTASAPGNAQIAIRLREGADLNGRVMATSSFVDLSTNASRWITFLFERNVAVIPQNSYALEFLFANTWEGYWTAKFSRGSRNLEQMGTNIIISNIVTCLTCRGTGLPAVVEGTVVPKFTSITVEGPGVTVSWSGGGILEEADSVSGPWRYVLGEPVSPYFAATTNASSASGKFFRIRR